MASDQQSAGDPLPEKCVVIEVRVGELKQLFNAMDPSPFREKDLDPSAEEFIVGWARFVGSLRALSSPGSRRPRGSLAALVRACPPTLRSTKVKVGWERTFACACERSRELRDRAGTVPSMSAFSAVV